MIIGSKGGSLIKDANFEALVTITTLVDISIKMNHPHVILLKSYLYMLHIQN